MRITPLLRFAPGATAPLKRLAALYPIPLLRRFAPPGATAPLMRLAPLRVCARSAERGFTLVSGIFLITILFLLSAYMVSFRVYQEAGVSLDTRGTRAYAAARSGSEWGAYNSLRNNACGGSTSLALGGSLAGYTATVTCSASPTYNEAGTSVTIDTIVANACNQPVSGNCPNLAPGAAYVERQLTITVAR